MTEQAKVPAIRFAGFTDPWEQRKLGELFFESNERSSSMEILSVSVTKGIYPASESDRDTNPGASLVNYKVVHKGDVVYNSMRMWQGAVGSSDYDGIVSPAYVVARPTIELDSTCFGYLLKRPEMLYKYLCDSQGNSKDTQTLKYDRFADIKATMPANLEEQRAISACLGSVDHLITLHQRKYDKLVVFKKSMLEKMFPKDGESVPEIRFAGFTDPWEQRKLGELVTTTIGGGTPSTSNPAYWDGEIPWIQSSNVLEDTLFDVDIPKAITQKGLEESAAQIVPENSIAVVTHVGVGKLIYLPFQYSTSQDFISLCGLKGDARYTCYALWKRLQEDLHIVQGSAIKGITKEDLLEKNLPMPSVEEQAQIGVLFSQLDSLITLHQRKLELLQNIKKSLLDKMFV